MASINSRTIPDSGFGLQGIYEQLKALNESISLVEKNLQYEEFWIEAANRQGPPHKFCSQHTLDVLQRTRQTLATMLELQAYLRRNAILRSRPTSSSLHILDLPHEILIKISVDVKGWQPDKFIFSAYSTGVKEVKNLRLTCWRLCNASSHLLLHHVKVKLNPTSLARLEEIAQHPTISKGIHAVRVVLNYHDEVLAQEFDEFLLFHMNRLQDATDWMEEPYNHDHLPGSMPKEGVLAKVKIYKRMFIAWTAWLQSDPSEIDMMYIEPMIECHAQYKDLLLVQKNLLDGGSFEQRIAVAFSKMPLAGRLELEDDRLDWSAGRPIPWHGELNTNGVLDFKYMLSPISWHLTRLHNFGSPPVNLLVTLPIAIHTAGHSLSDLHIEVSDLEDCSALVVRDQKRQQFSNAVHRLKNFQFCISYREIENPISAQQLDGMGPIFTSVFNSQCLQNVDFDLGFLWQKHMAAPSYSLGSLILFQTWKELSVISLSYIPIHLHELQMLLDNIAGKPEYLALRSMHLLSGTWTQALDVLRNKDMDYVSLNSPSGAELEDMTEEELEKLFTRAPEVNSRESLAERYILRRWDANRNPLLPELALDDEEMIE